MKPQKIKQIVEKETESFHNSTVCLMFQDDAGFEKINNHLPLSCPDDRIILARDGTAWHKSIVLVIPENIRLVSFRLILLK